MLVLVGLLLPTHEACHIITFLSLLLALVMSYQSFVVAPSIVNLAAFPWGMHNSYSAQGVETEETSADIVEDQEPVYRGLPLNFHISVPPVQPNPYASAAIIPLFPNNPALQYAHSGAPLALNVQPWGQTTQDGTPAAPT